MEETINSVEIDVKDLFTKWLENEKDFEITNKLNRLNFRYSTPFTPK